MDPREKILAANDRNLSPLLIPEWDETIYLPAAWSLADSETMHKSRGVEVSDSQRIASDIVLIVRRADGSQMFATDDIPALFGKNSDVLFRIMRRFNEIHGGNAAPNSEAAPV